nr:hypothetical protein [Tanacetum cinerariifolium]
MDVKSAFLYETIEEEVYGCQPPGFEDLDYPDKVYKVVYVDDIIFGSTNKELCKAFEKLIKDKFQMSSMGELTFFLGLEVKQKDDGIFISQGKYIAEILRKFHFTDVKSASTPIETEKLLLKDPDSEDMDVHIYRSMIRSIMYLTSSRLDIIFDVYACARFKTVVATSSSEAKYVVVASYCTQVLWIQNQLLDYGKELASPKQTALGVNIPRYDKDSLELMELMVFMQFWAKATIKKANDVVQFCTLIDEKNVVVTEYVNRRDLHLDDANGVECFPNEEIFAELARMGYEKPPPKLTFYKAFFFV